VRKWGLWCYRLVGLHGLATLWLIDRDLVHIRLFFEPVSVLVDHVLERNEDLGGVVPRQVV